MYNLNCNYDKVLKRIPYKYAVPIIVGRRAERLKEELSLRGEHVELAEVVSKAMKELDDDKIKLKNEDMMKLLKPEIK